jgi:hypothetical protein
VEARKNGELEIMNKTKNSLVGTFVGTLACCEMPLNGSKEYAYASKRLSSRLIIDIDGSYELAFTVDIGGYSEAFCSLIKAEAAYDAA